MKEIEGSFKEQGFRSALEYIWPKYPLSQFFQPLALEINSLQKTYQVKPVRE